MKAIIGLLIFGFVIYLWVKLIRFVGAILKVVNVPKPPPATPVPRQKDTQKSAAVSRPGKGGGEIVIARETPDEESKSLERNIDRSFEEMGLEIRFGHLPKAAKQMIKKAWLVRDTKESNEDEEKRKPTEALPRHVLTPSPVVPIREDIGFTWKTDDLQKAVVFSEIIAPPIALREE